MIHHSSNSIATGCGSFLHSAKYLEDAYLYYNSGCWVVSDKILKKESGDLVAIRNKQHIYTSNNFIKEQAAAEQFTVGSIAKPV